MKFSILQENLIQTLKTVKRAVPGKPQLPILAAFLIEAQKSGLTISATDLYLGIKSSVASAVEESGQIAVPAKIFYEIISHISPGKIDFSFENGTLTIKSNSRKTKLQCLAVDDFPPLPQLENKDDFIVIPDFIETLENVLFASSRDETRPILTSVLFSLEEEPTIVTTNGFRLAIKKFSGQFAKQRLLIPAKALTEVVAIARQDDNQVKLAVSQELKQVFFFIAEHEIMVRLMDGEFPPFEKIVPSSFSFEVEIDGEELIQELKAAQIFAKDVSNIVSFEFEKESLAIEAASSSLGQHRGQMPVSGSSEAASIAFNINYLLDFFQVHKPEKVWFGMNQSLQPAMFRVVGKNDFSYVVMPFKLNK